MTQRLIRERPIEFGIHVETPPRHHRKRRAKASTDSGATVDQRAQIHRKRQDRSVDPRHAAKRGDEFLEIAVADTGIGIKREDQGHIFEDFRQLDGSSTRHYGGTGVGLAFAANLPAALGGEIQRDQRIRRRQRV